MNWREYEKSVFQILNSRFPADSVESDARLPGRFSKINRQLDVVGHTTLMGEEMIAIVDCKYYTERVDVKAVETVIGMAADVRADVALIVTTVGFSEAAKARALNEPNVRTHLDIVSIEEAKSDPQAPAVACMYFGRIGAVALAPSGWIATSNFDEEGLTLPIHALCFFHSGDTTPEEAMKSRRVGWCYIADNPSNEPNQLEKLIESQKQAALKFDPTSEFELWREAAGDMDSKAHFRRITHHQAQYTDFTFFAELDDHGVSWTSMICPIGEEDEALRRLRFVANTISFAIAPGANPTETHELWRRLFTWIDPRADHDGESDRSGV